MVIHSNLSFPLLLHLLFGSATLKEILARSKVSLAISIRVFVIFVSVWRGSLLWGWLLTLVILFETTCLFGTVTPAQWRICLKQTLREKWEHAFAWWGEPLIVKVLKVIGEGCPERIWRCYSSSTHQQNFSQGKVFFVFFFPLLLIYQIPNE